MELRADKDKLDNEIAAINTDIKAKEAELKEERRGDNNQGIIDDINKSLDRLSTKEALLITQQTSLQHDIATQPNQGKFTCCQHVDVSLCHYVDRFPNSNVVSFSKCVLSVELTLFEGLSTQSFTFRPPPQRLVVRKGCFMKAIFPEGCLLG
jgi:hypothetical protein